jgi:hypothetical protein
MTTGASDEVGALWSTRRLGTDDGWTLDEGPILDRG